MQVGNHYGDGYGHVYVALFDNELVKVGMSLSNPEKRISDHRRTMAITGARIIDSYYTKKVPNPKYLERVILSKIPLKNTSPEWFSKCSKKEYESIVESIKKEIGEIAKPKTPKKSNDELKNDLWRKIQDIEKELSKESSDVYADLWRFGINVPMKISQLLSIKYKDISIDYVKVAAENGLIIKKPINISALEVIKKRRNKYPDHIYLFETNANRATKATPITRQIVSRVFGSVGNKKQINTPLSSKSMMIFRARIEYLNGRDLDSIAELLGQQNTHFVSKYIKEVEESKIDLVNDFSY
jgi:integrase